MSEEPQVFETIRKEITENDIVVFMKGNANFPQCGFSAQVVEVMKRLGINDYRDVNVLEDMDIREGIKAFSDWPTIPQLYVKGEFVGGCDIVREMYLNGELVDLLQDNGIAVEA
jgi:monothiol glutaredoxin